MALIACPDCHAQVSDKAPSCPKCGRPIAHAQERQPESEPETILYRGSPVMFRNSPISFMIYILIFVMGSFILYQTHQGHYGFYSEMTPIWMIPFGISLIVLLRWWLTCISIRLEITNKRARFRTGLLNKSYIELRHKDIRSVVVRQSFIQRMMGVGTIELSSSAEDDSVISVSGLRDPQKVAEIIQQHQE